LIVPTSSVRSTNSTGVKCGSTRFQTSSGTRVSATRVSDSVHSSAARSRLLKKGVSRQTATVARRRSPSPAFRASATCRSMQYAQPLTCEARSRTSSTSGRSSPERAICCSRPAMAFMASGLDV
jgi:hypothetical protein